MIGPYLLYFNIFHKLNDLIVFEFAIFCFHCKNSFTDINRFSKGITFQICRTIKEIQTNRIDEAVITFTCFICNFPFCNLLRVCNSSVDMSYNISGGNFFASIQIPYWRNNMTIFIVCNTFINRPIAIKWPLNKPLVT